WYQFFAVTMSGNSISTTEPGHAPSSTSTGASSTSHRPLKGLNVASTFSRYVKPSEFGTPLGIRRWLIKYVVIVCLSLRGGAFPVRPDPQACGRVLASVILGQRRSHPQADSASGQSRPGSAPVTAAGLGGYRGAAVAGSRGRTRSSWPREVMSSLVNTLRRW